MCNLLLLFFLTDSLGAPSTSNGHSHSVLRRSERTNSILPTTKRSKYLAPEYSDLDEDDYDKESIASDGSDFSPHKEKPMPESSSSEEDDLMEEYQERNKR